MNSLTIFEFDKLVEEKSGAVGYEVPTRVFAWLEMLSLRSDKDAPGWLRPTQLNGRRAIQVTSYVGILRAPCGFQIEVLPKTGRATSHEEARTLLIEMLKCLVGFRHIKTAHADLVAERMPLLEVFIQQFLSAVSMLVKRGLRSDYVARQENLFTLRGRLVVARQISQNLVRRDRFFTDHDEFSQDRAENRLIHTALRHVLTLCRSQDSQRAARELGFVFADVPLSVDVTLDIQRVSLDRGMGYYESALDWAKLILQGLSPISGLGKHHAPSLLFPMEAVFEAFVAKHLNGKLSAGYRLRTQVANQSLVLHRDQQWFRMKPDMLVTRGKENCLVLDTKWKLLDSNMGNSQNKYQLSQSDFYQLYAYGHHYLGGIGDLVLVYPKTDTFSEALPVFVFPHTPQLRLWVVPFCSRQKRLVLPKDPSLNMDLVTRVFA